MTYTTTEWLSIVAIIVAGTGAIFTGIVAIVLYRKSKKDKALEKEEDKIFDLSTKIAAMNGTIENLKELSRDVEKIEELCSNFEKTHASMNLKISDLGKEIDKISEDMIEQNDVLNKTNEYIQNFENRLQSNVDERNNKFIDVYDKIRHMRDKIGELHQLNQRSFRDVQLLNERIDKYHPIRTALRKM